MDLNFESSTFVSGNETVRAIRLGNEIVPYASIPHYIIYRYLDVLGRNDSKDFILTEPGSVERIVAVVMQDRKWDFMIESPNLPPVPIEIPLSEQTALGSLKYCDLPTMPLAEGTKLTFTPAGS